MFHIVVLFILILVLLYFFLEIKTRNIVFLLTIVIFIICWLPYAIGYFFENNILEKAISKKENVKFFISYIGTIIGSFITLCGVWWQVTRQEKQKEKDEKIGLLKTLHHYLEKTISDRDLERKKYSILSVLTFINSTSHIRDDIKAIPAFESMSFKENELKIMKLDYGENLLEINTGTISFNKEWIYLMKTSKKRKKTFEKIKAINTREVKELIEILENLSNIIYFYTKFNFTNEDLKEINLNKEKLLKKNNFDSIETYDDKNLKKLFDEKKDTFDKRSEETMKFLTELLVVEIWSLYVCISSRGFITEEEERELYEYYMSVSKIVSIDILELLDIMKKTDEKITKELEKLKKD